MVRPPQCYEEIGDLGTNNRMTEPQRDARRGFATLWRRTRSTLRDRGWDHHSGSISQLYVTCGDSQRLQWAWIAPGKGVLRIRLSFRDPTSHRAGVARVGSTTLERVPQMRPRDVKVRRASGVETVAEVRISMEELFSDCRTAEQMEERLAGTLLGVLDAAG